ncbi:putative phage related protein [Pseudescherichia vulneris]|nr:hypothetical protein [Pseudescherichia vulneris]STQ61087.1 putative phage related protein [Pseudescherichia vulneris]
MTTNWMRHFELQLTDDKGTGITLSDFRVVFSIDCFNISSQTSVGTFKIYNLADDTAQKIAGKGLTKIRVIAGYDGLAEEGGSNHGLIYTGDIRYASLGRESAVDTYVLIQAGDTVVAFSDAVTVRTLAAGCTLAEMNHALMQDFAPFGVTEGRTPAMPAKVYPRGRVLFGKTRLLMDEVARQCNASWMFVDGQRVMLTKDEYMHDAVVLNSRTGLVGTPTQTLGKGINVRCLITPKIRTNGLIHLNQAEVIINQQNLPAEDVAKGSGYLPVNDSNGNRQATRPASKTQLASIATDGVYIVRGINYRGDTRGQEWYMDMVCEARGSRDALSAPELNSGGDK